MTLRVVITIALNIMENGCQRLIDSRSIHRTPHQAQIALLIFSDVFWSILEILVWWFEIQTSEYRNSKVQLQINLNYEHRLYLNSCDASGQHHIISVLL